MADVDITKIIVLRGPAADLPEHLDAGELGFASDQGRLFVGSDPLVGSPQHQRSTFPYQNIEILTENSAGLFARMHGDRMREGGGSDYYTARMEANAGAWTNVRIERDNLPTDYVIRNIASVSAFIDYSVVNPTGELIRMGNMHLMYHAASESAPTLTDNGTARRNLLLTAPTNYQPEDVFGRVYFRFKVSGIISAPYLIFQYKNITSDVLNLRFKLSRPEAVSYDITNTEPDA